jgi:PleD family two-component response regulator
MTMHTNDPEEQTATDTLSPKERFLLAKAEHFIGRAEECIRMARYSPARDLIEKAKETFADVEGSEDLILEIDRQLFRIRHRRNGAAHGEHGGEVRHTQLILLADQDEQILVELGSALRNFGYHVLGAGNYEEAVRAMEEMLPDALISEVNFENGPRGFDLYHWMKRNIPDRSIPFLFLAARIDRETLIAGKRFGVDDFLQKPVDEEVVLASLINCLSRRRPQLLSA